MSVSSIVRLSTESDRDDSRHPDLRTADPDHPAALDQVVLAALLKELMRNADRMSLTTDQRELADRVFALLEGDERTIARLRARGWTAGDLAAGLRLRRTDVVEMEAEALDRLRSHLLADEELYRTLRRTVVGDLPGSRPSRGPSRQTRTRPSTPERQVS